jgi:pimeloyl-ACP methyl ester carboxylesterase
MNPENLQIRVHGSSDQPVLIYLPGLHGDWTLVGSFRAALAGRVRFVEFTYPRTTSWSLADYGAQVEAALLEQGITHGWLLGESFGSQVAWAVEALPKPQFHADGLILAGGFVRHPLIRGVRIAHHIFGRVSQSSRQQFLRFYVRFASFRHRHAPETLAELPEFVARRTAADWAAARHRLQLIIDSDPRPVTRRLAVPVYYLAGLVDPLVPWPWVRGWLRCHCPTYRAGKTYWGADHNVLATAPKPAAEQILRWMQR